MKEKIGRIPALRWQAAEYASDFDPGPGPLREPWFDAGVVEMLEQDLGTIEEINATAPVGENSNFYRVAVDWLP